MKTQEYRQRWEQARLVAYYTFKPHVKKGYLNSIKDLMQFEWEKPEKIELTEADYEYYLRKLGNHIDKDGVGYNA